MITKIKRILTEIKSSYKALAYIDSAKGIKKYICFLDMIYSIQKYGALADDYVSLGFYGMPASQRKQYITSGNKRLFYKKFYTEDALNTLSHKNLFNLRFNEFVKRDWIWSGNSSANELIGFAERHGKVLLKPVQSTWGKGIQIIDAAGLRDLLANNSLGNDNHFMLEEIIKNHPAMSQLNPYALHTLRVETVLDNKGDFHLLNVLLMVGMKKLIMSNCHSGGVMCHVNMTTGCVDKPGYNPQGWWAETSSEGIKFVGFKVPFISELEEYVKQVCKVMPEARYVGWDIAITPNGFELIEGNFCPGQCTQVCDGIPKYEMLKSFI